MEGGREGGRREGGREGARREGERGSYKFNGTTIQCKYNILRVYRGLLRPTWVSIWMDCW